MKTISHAASASSRLLISGGGGSSAGEIKPDGDSIVLGRWERYLFGAMTAGLVIAVPATILLVWPDWIEGFGVSDDVLGYVALGGACCSFLPMHVLVFYQKWKDMVARLEQTRHTAASDDLV